MQDLSNGTLWLKISFLRRAYNLNLDLTRVFKAEFNLVADSLDIVSL